MSGLRFLVLVWLALPALAAASAGLLQDGTVLLLRHAQAPGVGDPPQFRLGDCTTQRNLDEGGRAQARRLGERLRQQNVRVAAVWTSRWCRARETAALAFPDLPASEQPAFDSFFGERRERSPQQQREAAALLARWQGPGVLVVATHQVNITALTGMTLDSGDGVVVRPEHGRLTVLGRYPEPPAR